MLQEIIIPSKYVITTIMDSNNNEQYNSENDPSIGDNVGVDEGVVQKEVEGGMMGGLRG